MLLPHSRSTTSARALDADVERALVCVAGAALGAGLLAIGRMLSKEWTEAPSEATVRSRRSAAS